MSLRIDSAKAFVADSFGYDFKDNALLMEALDTSGLRKRESNQRLALLGDKIIAFLVADAWYATGDPKGASLNNIARIGRNATLTGIAQDIGLSQHVMLNPAQRTASDKLLATTMEALFAAIYLDADKDSDKVKFAMCRLDMDVVSDQPF